jgi:hypothetical protein
MGHRLKMIRVHAVTLPTEVIWLKSFGERAVLPLPEHPMGWLVIYADVTQASRLDWQDPARGVEVTINRGDTIADTTLMVRHEAVVLTLDVTTLRVVPKDAGGVLTTPALTQWHSSLTQAQPGALRVASP